MRVDTLTFFGVDMPVPKLLPFLKYEPANWYLFGLDDVWYRSSILHKIFSLAEPAFFVFAFYYIILLGVCITKQPEDAPHSRPLGPGTYPA